MEKIILRLDKLKHWFLRLPYQWETWLLLAFFVGLLVGEYFLALRWDFLLLVATSDKLWVLIVIALIGAFILRFLADVFLSSIVDRKFSPFKTVPYEHQVPIYKRNQLINVKKPGTYFLMIPAESGPAVDCRIRAITLPEGWSTEKTGISLSLEATLYCGIKDLTLLLTKLADDDEETTGEDAGVEQKSQTTSLKLPSQTDLKVAIVRIAVAAVRDTIAAHKYDEFLGDRTPLAKEAKTRFIEKTEAWGLEPESFNFGNVKFDQETQTLISQRARAELERSALEVKAVAVREFVDSVVATFRQYTDDPELALQYANQSQWMQTVRDSGSGTIFSVGGQGAGVVPVQMDRNRDGSRNRTPVSGSPDTAVVTPPPPETITENPF